MMRSLYSGVAGLKNHQTRMDVTGNNIANVNTVGYKAGRTTFQDMLSQSIKGASGPTGNIGGVNPLQVGLGMGVASVDNIFSTGSMQNTGKNTDLAIDGDGFFMVQKGMQTFYTRAGNFDFDSVGNYVIPGTGLQVMGWLADETGNINNSGNPVPLQVQLSKAMPPKATTLIGFSGNLKQDEVVGTERPTRKEVFDSEGVMHMANVTFAKADDYTWSVNFDVEGTTGGPYTGVVGFDKNGNYLYDTFSGDTTVISTDSVGFGAPAPTDTTTTPIPGVTVDVEYGTSPTPIESIYKDAAGKEYSTNGDVYIGTDGKRYTWNSTLIPPAWEAADGTLLAAGELTGVRDVYQNTITVTIDPSIISIPCVFIPSSGASDITIAPDLKSLTQYGIDSNATLDSQNGYTAGTLERATLSVDSNGVISGRFSNGESMSLGQVALALFTNPGGLTKIGSSLFAESNNSGVARIGIAGQEGYGSINPSTLEMSNVDLSEEFTTMITTQRGFQANSRIITTSDSMLEELVNLKR